MFPNILLITIDCLRSDHLGFLGYDRPATPNLDRLSHEAVAFTSAFATGPRTAESFPGIITSTYPLMFGGGYAMGADRTSVSEVLRLAGYETAAFHSNPYLSANYGYDRGFDTFWDSMEKVSGASRVGHRINAIRKLNRHTSLYRFLHRLAAYWRSLGLAAPFVRAGVLNQQALQWLPAERTPFFLWLHYMDPHYPYLPRDDHFRLFSDSRLPRYKLGGLFSKMLEAPESITAEERQLLLDLYDAEIHYMDEAVGSLLEQFKEAGLFDDLLIVVTADHGEEFGEHGEFSHATWASEVRDGRVIPQLHDELLHVPLLIRLPKGQYGGDQVDSLVSLLDIAPTILEYSGVEPPEGWFGQSLLPILNENQASRPYVISEYQVHNRGFKGPVIACRTSEWKYIHEGVFGHHELYDLKNDPREVHNLVGQGEEVEGQLASIIEDHQQLLADTDRAPEEVVVDEDVAERLRALGYME